MISIIIPAYNRLTDVLQALSSLQTLAAMPHEYIVQDDASPDVPFPAFIPPTAATTYRNVINFGFAGNCNAGAANAHGDILFFVNQDVAAARDWSEAWDAGILSAFIDPKVGIAGARLLFPINAGIQSAGGLFDGRGQPYHRCLGWSNPHHPEVSEPRPVSWVTGAALAIRREVFEQLGGFDTAYGRGYFEDVDLCVKAREAGWVVQYEPRCTLFHGVGASGGNPAFAQNAALFKSRWVDTGIVKPDTTIVHERFW